MRADATTRFSSRVDNYVKYRPGYPIEIIDLLTRRCGLTPSATVADIGSGTGILSELFLKFGCTVYGVEPNREMRLAGEQQMASYTRYHSIDGSAEATGLSDGMFDFITAGQALHWFDLERARREFDRIAKPNAWLALVWNTRLVDESDFLVGYERLLSRFPEYTAVDHRRIDDRVIGDFFGHAEWSAESFPNQQLFDFEALKGRLLSSSYTPQPGTPESDALVNDLRKLFEETNEAGRVPFLYRTTVYYGRLARE